jgi:hypothetical protein
MLSALILVVCLICYCCHRSSSKSSQYWQAQPEVFIVDEQVSCLATEECVCIVTGTTPEIENKPPSR